LELPVSRSRRTIRRAPIRRHAAPNRLRLRLRNAYANHITSAVGPARRPLGQCPARSGSRGRESDRNWGSWSIQSAKTEICERAVQAKRVTIAVTTWNGMTFLCLSRDVGRASSRYLVRIANVQDRNDEAH